MEGQMLELLGLSLAGKAIAAGALFVGLWIINRFFGLG